MLATRKLKELGLNRSEIQVYLFLLEHGISEPKEIAKATRITRTNCYGVLTRLLVRGLVEKSKSRPATYAPNSPTSLLQDIEYRKDIMSLILPELTNLYKSSDNKPIIKVYEGKEEVRNIYLQILDGGDILGFAATNKLHALYPDFFTGDWQEHFKKGGNTFHDILTHEEGNNIAAQRMKEMLGGLYEYRTLPESYGDIWTDLLIWEDKVALVNLTTPIMGTVIKNKQISDMVRLMFKLIWKSLDARPAGMRSGNSA